MKKLQQQDIKLKNLLFTIGIRELKKQKKLILRIYELKNMDTVQIHGCG